MLKSTWNSEHVHPRSFSTLPVPTVEKLKSSFFAFWSSDNKGLFIFLGAVDFRPPLCMAVSCSYVRNLVHLFLRINHFLFALYMEFFISVSFFIFAGFFLTSFFLIILWSNSDGPWRTRLLCFLFWQSNFIKSVDGGLQYEFIRTFYIKFYSCSTHTL